MPRYHRVNIDGISIYRTETRRTAAALLPGTFAVINDDNLFAPATGVEGRLYVVGNGDHQGLGITDAIPVGDSAVGNYVEEAREFAVLMPAGTYTKDQAITVGANGRAAVGETGVIGYVNEDVQTITTTAPDFIRVRMRGTGL